MEYIVLLRYLVICIYYELFINYVYSYYSLAY